MHGRHAQCREAIDDVGISPLDVAHHPSPAEAMLLKL